MGDGDDHDHGRYFIGEQFADGFAHPSVTKAEKPRIDAVILTIPGSIPKTNVPRPFARTEGR